MEAERENLYKNQNSFCKKLKIYQNELESSKKQRAEAFEEANWRGSQKLTRE